MLKNNDIISKLSETQKIRILSNVGTMTDRDFRMLGIPAIKTGYMKDFERERYPHAACLAHSWNVNLWSEVATARLKQMLDQGVNLFITPGAKVKFSPYRKEVSEDSYFAYRMATAQASSVSKLGGRAVLSGYYLTESDEEWLDKKPCMRVIDNEFISPFINAASDSGACALLTNTRELSKEYGNVPEFLRAKAKGEVEYLLCMEATDENTVALLNEGVICLKASENAISAACARYAKNAKQIESGALEYTRQIDDVRNGAAMSPELLDAALDRVIDFLADCRTGAEKMREAQIDVSETLMYRSALESTVLLKNNNNILPLKKTTKIGIIGDINDSGVDEDSLLGRCRASFEENGYECVGISKGYNDDNIYDDKTFSASLKLAEADVIILLMGISYSKEKDVLKNETLSLPANQLRLAHELRKNGKPIIGVVSDAYTPDIGFSRSFDALLLAPLECYGGAVALADVICGRQNPSARLAYTLYAESDTAFAKRAIYKEKYGLKTGPFIGYKYYDTAGITVGYPFGHGLSYSRFEYSKISYNPSDRTVSVEVQNTSAVSGIETVQIYVGRNNSNVISPKKTLCQFVRLELAPGQKKRISCAIKFPTVRTENGSVVELEGNYTIYVGRSVSDIRLTQSVQVHGVQSKPDGERLIDYIQSESNVKTDKYTLEANLSFMKKSYINIVTGVCAVALSIGVAAFNSNIASSFNFLSFVSLALAVAAVVFFVRAIKEHEDKDSQRRAALDAASAEAFANADKVGSLGASTMFHNEFDVVQDKDEDDLIMEADLDDVMAAHVDTSFKLADISDEFMRYAQSKGYQFSRQTVENLFASMSTAKLIVTRMDDEDFNSLILLLSEYFGTGAFVDDYDAENNSGVFFTRDAHGDSVRKNVMLALAAASADPVKIFISATKGVAGKNADAFLAPFVRYIGSPKEKNSIEIFNKSGANVGYNIAPNLWFFINLAGDEQASALPISIARMASLNMISFTRCEASEARAVVRNLNRYQLAYIANRAVASDIAEDMWKKFDKLEKYAREYSDYRIGNKLWRGFEKHISLLIDCGTEPADAADITMATRLLLPVAVVTNGKGDKDSPDLLDTVSFVFGQENIAVSSEIIKNLLADKGSADASEA